MSNHLAGETSPYLLQHAQNPVDWYPWGDSALDKAQREDKPIFLSIGYSACHWCHVMAHESFEDEKIAEILNENFVSIKVDREERPDLDQIYMDAVQAMTGSGGWPMSVFLTPDGHPFFGGTYFPPEPRHGMPAFEDVLLAVLDAWENRRDQVEANGQQLAGTLEQRMRIPEEAAGGATIHTLEEAQQRILDNFDSAHGGWSSAPKFPQPMLIEFLLRSYQRTENAAILQMVTQTLEAMARGGIYDQIGGGFHRYSVDENWLVPHFEKMLYDNAQLARVYLHAWQVTGNELFRAVTEETLDYLIREMLTRDGGFASSQDADVDGEEGAFYTWTAEELRSVLGDQAERFMEAYGASSQGNFEGKNILTFAGKVEEREDLEDLRRKLFLARETRAHPDRDDKVLTAWNGLALAAFAEAGRVLDRDDYRTVAEETARFLIDALMTDEGQLHRVWKDGRRGGNGTLDDYANLAEGLLELYQTTFDPHWYEVAHRLIERIREKFSAAVGFYDTSEDHETLIVRPRQLQDTSLPSGNSMAVSVLLRIAPLAEEPTYAQEAKATLDGMKQYLERYPLGFGQWLTALDYATSHPQQIAIVAPSPDEAYDLLEACLEGYHPRRTVGLTEPDRPSAVPLLNERDLVDGRATAYVCSNFTCHPPVAEAEELKALLEE